VWADGRGELEVAHAIAAHPGPASTSTPHFSQIQALTSCACTCRQALVGLMGRRCGAEEAVRLGLNAVS